MVPPGGVVGYASFVTVSKEISPFGTVWGLVFTKMSTVFGSSPPLPSSCFSLLIYCSCVVAASRPSPGADAEPRRPVPRRASGAVLADRAAGLEHVGALLDHAGVADLHGDLDLWCPAVAPAAAAADSVVPVGIA